MGVFHHDRAHPAKNRCFTSVFNNGLCEPLGLEPFKLDSPMVSNVFPDVKHPIPPMADHVKHLFSGRTSDGALGRGPPLRWSPIPHLGNRCETKNDSIGWRFTSSDFRVI